MIIEAYHRFPLNFTIIKTRIVKQGPKMKFFFLEMIKCDK